MKFKVGDRVRTNYNGKGKEETYTITEIRTDNTMYLACLFGSKDGGFDSPDCVELVSKKGKKEKPIRKTKFIAIYDETDRDPHETFITRKELNKWLKESKEDEDIIFSSIKVFEIKKEFEVKTSFSLKAK